MVWFARYVLGILFGVVYGIVEFNATYLLAWFVAVAAILMVIAVIVPSARTFVIWCARAAQVGTVFACQPVLWCLKAVTPLVLVWSVTKFTTIVVGAWFAVTKWWLSCFVSAAKVVVGTVALRVVGVRNLRVMCRQHPVMAGLLGPTVRYVIDSAESVAAVSSYHVTGIELSEYLKQAFQSRQEGSDGIGPADRNAMNAYYKDIALHVVSLHNCTANEARVKLQRLLSVSMPDDPVPAAVSELQKALRSENEELIDYARGKHAAALQKREQDELMLRFRQISMDEFTRKIELFVPERFA